ncbi:hypothetical protein KCU95_g104, partial [Aureobasidium melanogenum]
LHWSERLLSYAHEQPERTSPEHRYTRPVNSHKEAADRHPETIRKSHEGESDDEVGEERSDKDNQTFGRDQATLAKRIDIRKRKGRPMRKLDTTNDKGPSVLEEGRHVSNSHKAQKGTSEEHAHHDRQAHVHGNANPISDNVPTGLEEETVPKDARSEATTWFSTSSSRSFESKSVFVRSRMYSEGLMSSGTGRPRLEK